MDINDATDLVESLVYAVVEYEDMCAKGRDADELEAQYEKQQEITKQLIAALATEPNQPPTIREQQEQYMGGGTPDQGD